MEIGVDFISKKGTQISVLNLKEYIDQSIEEENYLESKTHYIVECPHCNLELNYHKKKLYILKNYSVGYCFRCNTAFVSINEESTLKFGLELPEPNIRLQDFKLIKLESGTWNLDLFNQLQSSDPYAESYLFKRNPYIKKLLPALGIRFLDHNPAKKKHSQVNYTSTHL